AQWRVQSVRGILPLRTSCRRQVGEHLDDMPLRLPELILRDFSLGHSELIPHPPLPHEIHVWRLCLDKENARLQDAKRILSPEEQSRAARFRFERDHNEFVLTRGSLRCLLGAYVDRPPTEISFEYSAHGRPRLVRLASDAPIDFNVSHSAGYSVLAFALS